MRSDASPADSWSHKAVARRWPGAWIERISSLKGDASERRFWRLHLSPPDSGAPRTAILVDLGPDDLPPYVRALKMLGEPVEEPPWLNIHRFLRSIGSPVPALYHADPGRRLMLVEDVGETSLFAAAERSPSSAADLYRQAIDQLFILHVDGQRRLGSECLASRIAYDQRLFRWEMEEFAEVGIEAVASGANRRDFERELDRLALRLGRLPRVFSHRDYHGWNLFVDDDAEIRILDFQDALMAPPVQDLAVLLTTRNTSRLISPAAEHRLLTYYVAGLARRGVDDTRLDEFIENYRLAVLQHALKVIGRFTVFERDGKTGYSAYVPYALDQARRMLAESGDDFPGLRRALAG